MEYTVEPMRALLTTSLVAPVESAPALLRRLGRQLTPVVVDFGPRRARFESHLEWDPTNGGPLLAPIAGELLAEELRRSPPLQIRCADPDEPWGIIDPTITVLSERVARFAPEPLRIERMPDRAPPRPSASTAEQLTMIIRAGHCTLDDHVLPIVNIGATHCIVESVLPLAIAREVPVHIIGQRRIVRRARAALIETLPWVTAQAERRFRCRFSIASELVPGLLDDGFDRVSGVPRIKRLLQVFAHRHPNVALHEGAGFADMVDLYDRAGVLKPYMRDRLRDRGDEMAADWQKLHDRASSVAFTLLARDGDETPVGANTCVRAWDGSWLLQHFGVVAAAAPGAGAALLLAASERILARADTRYISFFLSGENGFTKRAAEHFAKFGGTSEAMRCNKIARWLCPADGFVPPSSLDGHELRLARKTDEQFVTRAAERALGPLAARALSIVPGALALEATSRSFAERGLERRRSVLLLSKGKRIVAVLLREQTSPGVNLTLTFNAWWLIPVHASGLDDSAVAAAAAAIANAPEPAPRRDKLLLLPGSSVLEPLARAGFRKLDTCYLYTMNRAGALRYQIYMTNRLGELQTLIDKRRARPRASMRAAPPT